jgi:phosphoserine phosphatase RsbU/P
MERRTLRYAGAGHPPVLMCDGATRSVRDLDENGFFLSWTSDATYSSREVPLGQGDWVILYTDGITETRNRKKEEFGMERFRDFAESNSSLSAEIFATKLLDEVLKWSGRAEDEEPDDDVTLVVAHVKSS